MGRNKSSFPPMLMTCCFVLVIVLFVTPTPEGFSARTLESIPPIPNEAAKNQSKGEVGGSVSSHDGSAAGNSTPTGVVKVSPPTSVTRISYGTLSYSPPPPPPDYPEKTASVYSPPSDYPDEPVSAYNSPPTTDYPDYP